MQRTVQGALASPGTAVMGKAGAHSVLRWTVEGRTVLRELTARHEGGQDPGEMSALGGTQSAQMTCFQRPARPRGKQSMGAAGKMGAGDSGTQVIHSPWLDWQGLLEVLQPCPESSVTKVPQPGHPEGTLTFGLKRAGGGELSGDPITARPERQGAELPCPAPRWRAPVTNSLPNSRPSGLVYPESLGPKWQAATVASSGGESRVRGVETRGHHPQ